MLKSSYGGKKIELQKSTSFHKYTQGFGATFLTSNYAMPLKDVDKKPLATRRSLPIGWSCGWMSN